MKCIAMRFSTSLLIFFHLLTSAEFSSLCEIGIFIQIFWLWMRVLCVGTQQGRRGSRPLQQPTTEEPWWAQDACKTSRLDNQGDITAPLCSLCTFDWHPPPPVSVCQGIILVYDITDEKSFENIQNWMKSIKEVRLFPLSPDKDIQEILKNSA